MSPLAKLITILLLMAIIFGAIALYSAGTATRENARASRIMAEADAFAVRSQAQADAYAVRSQASMPYVLFAGLLGVGVLVFLSRQRNGQNSQPAPQPQVIILQVPAGSVAALPGPQNTFAPVEIFASQELILVD